MDAVDKILAQWGEARPDLDVRAMGPVGRLARLAHHFSGEMAKTFRAHGLNAAGFDVLATLRRTPSHALTAGELMVSMMITSGTMTNRIDQLEKAGLVCRTADPNDARKAVVKLTDQGQTLIDAALVDIDGLSHEEAAEKFTISADNLFSASSKDNLVRVEFSKNKLATVISLSEGTFLMGLFKMSLK